MKIPNDNLFPTATPVLSATSGKSEPKLRLEYLDGLRGLAALLVFLYHVCREIDWRLQGGELPPLVLSAGRFLPYGRIAVAIFIVLSGYCLMLPVVRSTNGQLPGGWLNYFKRRARRILPPYYAALVLSVLLLMLVPAELNPTMGLHWNDAQPALTPGALLSHVLLLHNLKKDWLYTINGPMWSVATEGQIYFFLPFLLLPVWKRFGLLLTVFTAFAVGLTPHYLLHRYLDWAVPWYLGLFALGMAGAAIGFSKQPSLIIWREKLPWGLLCLGFIAVFASQRSLWEDDRAWIVDALIGAVTACLLIYCTQRLTTAKSTQRPLILQLFDSRWSVALGVFSYSLYLVHAPLLGLSQLFVSSLPISHGAKLLTLPIVAVPLGLVLSYWFHLAFERRFMHSSSRKEKVIQ